MSIFDAAGFGLSAFHDPEHRAPKGPHPGLYKILLPLQVHIVRVSLIPDDQMPSLANWLADFANLFPFLQARFDIPATGFLVFPGHSFQRERTTHFRMPETSPNDQRESHQYQMVELGIQGSVSRQSTDWANGYLTSHY
jgi:hypothetical protein